MYIFNYLYLKQSINTDELNFNTYNTIINYILISAPTQNFSQIMSFSSFGFLPFYHMLETTTQKFYCFV